MPALVVCTQALGEPRYPSLKGIMAARSKEIATKSLADVGVDAASVGGGGGHDEGARLDGAAAAGRDAGRARATGRGRARGRRIPRPAEDRLMAGLWVIGEVTADGGLARISTEVATLARTLAEAAGQDVVGIVVAADPKAAAAELATYLPRVLALTEPAAADHAWAMIAADRIAGVLEPDTKEFIFVGAGPDGRDVAGALSALTGWGILANTTAAAWADGGPTIEMSVFGGKLTTTSRVHRPTRDRHGPAERRHRRAGGVRRERSRRSKPSAI